jgi:predicted RNA-binding protein with PIN domain
MLWLIDGYNLMHAAGAIGAKELGRQAFQRKRRRFLSELADSLGFDRARETTVVFDANSPPADFSLETSYKGLTLIFALGDENADARIEQLIGHHSAPKALTVVSSDRRVRQAATRRKARAIKADDFLDLVDRWKAHSRQEGPSKPDPPSSPVDRNLPPSAEEAALWLEEFGYLDESPEAKEAFTPGPQLLTDAEIARIQREIDEER